jgi:hypothetical protein
LPECHCGGTKCTVVLYKVDENVVCGKWSASVAVPADQITQASHNEAIGEMLNISCKYHRFYMVSTPASLFVAMYGAACCRGDGACPFIDWR